MNETLRTSAAKDQRIAYGALCSWWGPIQEVGTTLSGLPCCPQCWQPLYEVPSPKAWWDGVDAEVARGDNDYRTFIEWLQGKCYFDFTEARDEFNRSNL